MELQNNILELKHPKLKQIIEYFLEYIQNKIVKDYRKNEYILRNYNGSSEYKEAIENYNKKLYNLNNLLYKELSKNDVISGIIGGENDSSDNSESDDECNEFQDDPPLSIYDFCDEFLEDYYLIFIYNNIINNLKDFFIKNNNENNYIENIKKLLKYMVYLKNEYQEIEPKISLRDLAKILNWIQSYRDEITIILKMFSKLNTIIIDLFQLIQNIIETRTAQYEILGRNNTASSIVNKVFFLVFG